ncbi:MAG: type II toxin-antitoxin system VapC family toxin [archaeon GB-1867-035]|nr:type II toxin-antitoxin system VapC family toxin [Candidatus Culexmicrobium profundum]
MIIIDTSTFIDAIIPFKKDRHKISLNLLNKISQLNLIIYEPKIFIIELSGVLTRYKPKEAVINHLNKIIPAINLIEYNEIHNLALEIALQTSCRAIDALFMASAKHTNSILISNDKTQIKNAKKANIEAYYLPKEHTTAIKRIEKYKQSS